LFQLIRERISKFKSINTLYLSRYYKTFDEFDVENIYRLIEEMKYYRIDSNENFEEKVSGIIWKKTKSLKTKGSQIQWRKGNFQKILDNINRNLLKLNIALRMWEQKNSLSNPITFDEIDSNKILHQFFSEHKLDKIKSDALYTYCLQKCRCVLCLQAWLWLTEILQTYPAFEYVLSSPLPEVAQPGSQALCV
jgi:hypothetical protein